MATTKTLTPTNQAITLAAFTEKPDNRTNVTNDDKLADAVNTLNSKLIVPQTATDANDCKATGIYKVGPSVANTPYSGYWTIYAIPYTENLSDTNQLAMDVNNGRMFNRSFHDRTTWTSWQEVVRGGIVSPPSLTFVNFTGTVGNINCYQCGDVFTLGFTVTVDSAAATQNAQIARESLPNNGKSILHVSGTWYDNTNDTSGDFANWRGSGVRFLSNGERENFTARVGHNIAAYLTYIAG